MLRCPVCQSSLENSDATGCSKCAQMRTRPSGAQARLVLKGTGGLQAEYPLTASLVVIGRSTSATIQLADREVSRRHTGIETVGTEHMLSDLGSSNGTFLNGRRIDGATPLRDGDEVTLGTTRLVYRAETRRNTVVLQKPAEQASVLALVEQGGVFLPVEEIDDERVLRRDYERLRIAHEFQRFVGLERNLQVLLARILDVAFELIPAQNGVILLPEPETGRLSVEAVRQDRDREASVLISETLLAHVTSERKGVLTSDALYDERFSNSDSMIALGVRSCMAVPLVAGEQVRGVMFLDSRERIGAFTKKDLEVLSAIAAQATIALENSEMARTIEQSAAKRAFLERFLSPRLAEEVERGKIELSKGGVLRELTVLFSDIRGFTAMSEAASPTETVEMLNEYFEIMADCVFAYGGIVDKFIGDAVMALFGAPVAGTDDAERAVRSALLMQAKTREFNEGRRRRGLAPIGVGIGLHTGEAVVGVIGSTKRLEYTAIGDTVNVASRLCAQAPANVVLLSEHCLSKAGAQHFPARALAPLHIKGRTAPLNAYAIEA